MIGIQNRGNLPTVVEEEFDNFATRIRQFFLFEHNEDGSHIAAQGPIGVPTGALVMWAAANAPTGFLICDGSAVNRSFYKALYEVIGTTYGAGDGSTTFNLPDLRQRFPLGKAAAGTGSALGATGGAIDHTHSSSLSGDTGSAGTHDHGLGDNSISTTSPASGSTFYVDVGSTYIIYGSNHTHVLAGTQYTDSAGSHTHGAGTLSVSGGATNPPFVTVNYIIKT